MLLNETLFIGSHNPNPTQLPPLSIILDHYAVIRDAIAGTGHIETQDLTTLVANQSLIYAFNTYKAISLLLPHLYHESSAAIFRQLWEVSLNLHWIGGDPATRSQDFCNFTVMEFRKIIKQSGDSISLKDFDEDTAKFQTKFRYRDKNGRNRTHRNFTTTSIYDRAVELGVPWKYEYELVYNLTSLHSHGAPGAVLQGIFRQQYSDSEVRETNSAALIATLAIKVMVRNVQLLVQMNIIPDASSVLAAFDDFQETLTKYGNT